MGEENTAYQRNSIKRENNVVRKHKTTVHLITVKIKAGPFKVLVEAQNRQYQASRIPNSEISPIKRVKSGFTFDIIQKFGAKTLTEKNQIIKQVHAHRNNSNVPGQHVKITTKTIKV